MVVMVAVGIQDSSLQVDSQARSVNGVRVDSHLTLFYIHQMNGMYSCNDFVRMTEP